MHIVNRSFINPSLFKGWRGACARIQKNNNNNNNNNILIIIIVKGWRGAGAGIQTRAASDEAAHLTSLLHVQGEK